MRQRIGKYVRNSIFVFGILSLSTWFKEFLPILTGTFEPDMNNSLDIVRMYSNPWAQLVGKFLTVLIIAPVFGTIIALVVSIFKAPPSSQELNANSTNSWSITKTLGITIVVLIGLASCYDLSRPTRSNISSNTQSELIRPEPTSISPTIQLDQWKELSNTELSLRYPLSWELLVFENENVFENEQVAFSGRDFFVYFSWLGQETSNSFYFDAEGNSVNYSTTAKEEVEKLAKFVIEGQGGTITDKRFFERKSVGKFDLVGFAGYEAKASGYKLFDDTNSILTFLPNIACGEYRMCQLSYAKAGSEPMTENEWNIIETFMNSVNFTDDAVFQAQSDGSQNTDTQKFSNKYLSIYLPRQWIVDRSVNNGLSTSGLNEIFNIEWRDTEYPTSTLTELDLSGSNREPVVENMLNEVRLKLEAEGAEIISVEMVEMDKVGSFEVFAEAVFAIVLTHKDASDQTVSYAMVPSAICGSKRVCSFTYGRTDNADVSETDWIQLDETLQTLKFVESVEE